MALARQHKRDQDLVEGVDLSEIDIAVANAQKSSDTSGAGSEDTPEPKKEPEGPNRFRRTLVVAGVVLASLIMALSILLPSLSAVIEGLTSGSEATTEQATTEESESDQAATDDASEAETEDSAASQMQEYIDTVDERYGATADALQAKVDADASDTASLINLANTYYDWGSSITYYATSDEQKEHSTELLQKAMNLYDQYLASNSSNAAQVSKALCQYYMGDVASAISALEDFCAKDATYAPAWSNLGMMYNAQGDTEKALSAYKQVTAVDPDDKYGLKSTAESQISTLSASTEEATTASE